MNKTVKVAAAQIAPVYLNRERTVDKVCRTILEAGENGAQLVVFPETIIPGYPYWAMVKDPSSSLKAFHRELSLQAVEIESPKMDPIFSAAEKAGCYAVIGINEKAGGTLYNTQIFINPDGFVIGKHRKLMPTSHERMVWGWGDGTDLQVWQTPIGILGGLICYEHTNALYRYAIQAQGEQIHVAGWPGGMPEINDIMDAAIRHYAFEAQAFVISSTSIITPEIISALGEGESVSRLSPGGGYSAIVDPTGQYLAGPATEGETILYAELDFTRIVEIKRIVDSAGHYARPDVVHLVVNRKKQSPLIFEENEND